MHPDAGNAYTLNIQMPTCTTTSCPPDSVCIPKWQSTSPLNLLGSVSLLDSIRCMKSGRAKFGFVIIIKESKDLSQLPQRIIASQGLQGRIDYNQMLCEHIYKLCMH